MNSRCPCARSQGLCRCPGPGRSHRSSPRRSRTVGCSEQPDLCGCTEGGEWEGWWSVQNLILCSSHPGPELQGAPSEIALGPRLAPGSWMGVHSPTPPLPPLQKGFPPGRSPSERPGSPFRGPPGSCSRRGLPWSEGSATGPRLQGSEGDQEDPCLYPNSFPAPKGPRLD